MRGLTTAPEAGMRSEPSSMLGQVAVLIICNVCGNWGKGCNPAIPRPMRGLTTAPEAGMRSEPSSMLGQMAVLIICNVCGT